MSCCPWSPPCSEVRGEQGHNTLEQVREWGHSEKQNVVQDRSVGWGVAVLAEVVKRSCKEALAFGKRWRGQRRDSLC